MTKEEAIARIKDHKIIHKMNEPRAIFISEALDMAIKALEQEPCEDAIGREATQKSVIPLFRDGIIDEYNRGYNDCYEEVLEKIRELPSVQPKANWIPVTDRLPKAGEEVLVCGYDTYNKKVIISRYQGKQYGFTCGLVSAWMPLPKPYEPQESEDKE